MLNADSALSRLKRGNELFRSGVLDLDLNNNDRSELEKQQNPFAIILGCSDSRVSPELIFAQNLGRLFVIRVAGNIAMPSQIGTIEFAANKFATKLIVVLGHSSCGAIEAAVENLENTGKSLSPNLQVIIDGIKPGIKASFSNNDPLNIRVQKATRANVQSTIENLLNNSKILQNKVTDEGLKIVGAEYYLKSGTVEFY